MLIRMVTAQQFISVYVQEQNASIYAVSDLDICRILRGPAIVAVTKRINCYFII